MTTSTPPDRPPASTDEWTDRARRWWRDDPLHERAELEAVLERADAGELADRLGSTVPFGTSGLRAPLGAGPGRMNRVIAARAVIGLLHHLPPAPTVVVGHDARHGSLEIADAVASVIDAAGGTVHRPSGPEPTPLLAYAVRHLSADAGVVVTASHNPAADNGVKLYTASGLQVAPPLDAAIASFLDRSLPEASRSVLDRRGVGSVMGSDVRHAYLAMARRLVEPGPRDLRIVYTPLHGVAGDLALGALATSGFGDVHVVDAQRAPDPDFPTVSGPNPEDPAALALALAEGERIGADLVVAHDPDGDRLAAAVPTPAGYRVLSGNELGTLFAHALLARPDGAQPDARPVVASTFVSTAMIERIAQAAGARHVATPTGFKWVMQAVPPAGAGERFAFGFEEALGFAVTDEVRDKDGITALVVLADLVARLRAGGHTVVGELERLAMQHGVHRSHTTRFAVDGRDGLERRAGLMRRLRADPPTEIGGDAVVASQDHLTDAGPWPPTDLLTLVLASGARVQLRPSGTEPQLKCYVEVVERVPPTSIGGADDAFGRADRDATRRLDALVAAVSSLVATFPV